MKIIISVFFMLHGLVYMLYFGQSARLFELQAGMVWPDGSWAFSRFLGDEATRLLASITCVLAAVGFVAGGIGKLAGQDWWRPFVIVLAAFSALMVILFWDGKMQKLHDKGGVGLLINLVILAVLLILRWPRFEL